MITCEDWRQCAPDLIAPLIADEIAAWRTQLDWDIRTAWQVVEPARSAKQLPGFISRDRRGRVAGWTSFLLHRQCLQVMTLVGRNAAVVTSLTRAVLDSPEAAHAANVLICVRAASAGLREALVDHGFRVEPYRYLAVDLETGPAPVSALRPWDHDDDVMTRLCASAYADSDRIRAFAPGGTSVEWHEYIASLLKGPGCGEFRTDWSFVAPGSAPSKILGGVMTTAIAPGVAHIAQMAVAPDHQGRGIGRKLVTAAMAAASATCRRMTLLVAESNQSAVRLYESVGFRDVGMFLVAMRDQPRVSTSLALATGGESTRL